MKTFLPVFLCLFLISTGVFAQPVDKEREQRTYQEAIDVYQECTTTSYLSNYHDCRCVAGAFYNARLAEPAPTQRGVLLGTILPQCPDLPRIASIKYQQCIDWAKLQRPDNYQEYCQCYGATFAKNFEGQTAPLSRIEPKLAKFALKRCNQDYPLKGSTPAEDREFKKRLEDTIMN